MVKASGIHATVADGFWTQQDARGVVLGTRDRSLAQFWVAVISRSVAAKAGQYVRHFSNRSARKDCVKQHMRRRHPDLVDELEVVTLPAEIALTYYSSIDWWGLSWSPEPIGPIPSTHSPVPMIFPSPTLQALYDAIGKS